MRNKPIWKFSCILFFQVCWHENIFMSYSKDGWILMVFFFIIYIDLCWFTLIYLDLPWKWTWINVNRRKYTRKNSLGEINPYENFLIDFFSKYVDMGIFSCHIPKMDQSGCFFSPSFMLSYVDLRLVTSIYMCVYFHLYGVLPRMSEWCCYKVTAHKIWLLSYFLSLVKKIK